MKREPLWHEYLKGGACKTGAARRRWMPMVC